jgi:hypothetical protein
MPKIKLNAIESVDMDIFDTLGQVIDVEYTNDVFTETHDGYPILTRWYILQHIWLINTIKSYLDANVTHKFFLLDKLEGTNTTLDFFTEYKLNEYALRKQIVTISAGSFSDAYEYINVDSFHNAVAKNPYNTKISLEYFDTIFTKIDKPYKFLFLNRAERVHRKILTEELVSRGLLNGALWSNLVRKKYLPTEYKDFLNSNLLEPIVAGITYEGNWPDGLLNPSLYIDTYFSVVTETNPDVSSRYFTEKIYKVLLMGHPFIVASGPTFYRHLHNQGYLTFGNLIDESFDDINNTTDRMKRIAQVVDDLCRQDLPAFLRETKSICEHNRNRFFENIGKKDMEVHQQLFNYFNNAKTK